MKTKPKFLGLLFVVCWLLAACTTPGESTLVESGAVVTEAATTVASPTPTIPATEAPTNERIEHNGISFTYDPTLFGDEVIQEFPASANQGLFDQPTPAHTRIGFASSSIVHDSAYPWRLTTVEPNIAIYNLHDFGSYAIGDRYTRAQIAQVQELLDKRPSTITETIPVILHVNAEQTFRTHVQWLDFGNGSGVRFVTRYDQAPSPITNERLAYIFQGITADGLHGVTAVFPLDAPFLSAGVTLDEAAYAAFIENVDAEMAAAIEQLNTAVDSDFNPHLSQLDALVQSLSVLPTANDFPLTAHEPHYGRALADADVLNAPDGDEVIGNLQSGDTVILNASSADGRYRRILCQDGSTGSCWVAAEAVVETTSEADPVSMPGVRPKKAP